MAGEIRAESREPSYVRIRRGAPCSGFRCGSHRPPESSPPTPGGLPSRYRAAPGAARWRTTFGPGLSRIVRGLALALALPVLAGLGMLASPQVAAQTDTTPPSLTSATVSSVGTQIHLIFSEDLHFPSGVSGTDINTGLKPAFTVKAGGASLQTTFASVIRQDGLVTLEVSPAVQRGLPVTITYTDPTPSDDDVAIQDEADNEAPNFTTGVDDVPAVVNNSTNDTDTTPPSLTSATVNSLGNQIALQFSESLHSPTGVTEADYVNGLKAAFTVTVGGVPPQSFQVLSAAISGSLVLSSVSPAIQQGDTVIVTYKDPTPSDDDVAIQDAANNEAPNFTTGVNGVPAVDNDSTVEPPPDPPPGKPRNLAATGGNEEVTLNWEAPSSDASGVQGYQYRFKPEGAAWSDDDDAVYRWHNAAIGHMECLCHTVRLPPNGRTYSFQVRAYRLHNVYGPASDEVSATTSADGNTAAKFDRGRINLEVDPGDIGSNPSVAG